MTVLTDTDHKELDAIKEAELPGQQRDDGMEDGAEQSGQPSDVPMAGTDGAEPLCQPTTAKDGVVKTEPDLPAEPIKQGNFLDDDSSDGTGHVVTEPAGASKQRDRLGTPAKAPTVMAFGKAKAPP